MFHQRLPSSGGGGGGGGEGGGGEGGGGEGGGVMGSSGSSYEQPRATTTTAAATTTTAAAAAAGKGAVATEKNYNSNTCNNYNTTNNNTTNKNSKTSSNKKSGGNFSLPSSSPSSCLRSLDAAAAVSDLSTIQAAQKSFKCPKGFKLSTVPPASSANRSRMYTYGVRVDALEMTPTTNTTNTITTDNDDNNNGKTKADAVVSPRKAGHRPNGRFYCLASHGCRMTNNYLRISKGSTSSVTDHLAMLHGGPALFKKTPPDAALSKVMHTSQELLPLDRNSESFERDKERLIVLCYVKTSTILGFQPLDWMENPERCLTMDLMSEGQFRTEALSAKRVKKAVVEMYDATKREFVRSLAKHLASARTRILHVSIDLWTAKASVHKDKFIGLRVFLLSESFTEQTFLLAVKQYKPAPDLNGKQTGHLITLWAEQVLHEFRLDWSMVASAVTDSSSASGVKFAVENIPGVLREWCIPHMMNRAIIDAFGLASSPEESHNVPAREVMVRVREAAEQMKQSATGRMALEDCRKEKDGSPSMGGGEGLRQAIAQRWSTATLCLERVSAYISAHLAQFRSQEEGGAEATLAGTIFEREVEEVYSLMKALQHVIQGSQSTRFITSVPTMSGLVMLLTRDLNANRPLLLHGSSSSSSPPSFFSHHPTRPSPNVPRPSLPPLPPPPPPPLPAQPQKERIERPHAELTPAGRSTRLRTREAVWRRFGSRRYGGENFKEESHLFDMAMALNPGCRALGYIDVLSPTPDLAEAVKDKVWAQLTSRVGEVVAAERAAAAAAASSTVIDKDRARAQKKRPRFTQQQSAEAAAQLAEMQQSGLYDDVVGSSGEETEDEEGGQSVSAEAYILVDEWRHKRIPKALRKTTDGEELGNFWRTYGRQNFRVMSEVARGVLGARASAAVLERDFGEVGTLFSRHHQQQQQQQQQQQHHQQHQQQHEHHHQQQQQQRCNSAAAGPPAYVEMVMFLRGVYDSIPPDIPELGDEDFEKAIPVRLRGGALHDEVAGLFVVAGSGGGDGGGGGGGASAAAGDAATLAFDGDSDDVEDNDGWGGGSRGRPGGGEDGGGSGSGGSGRVVGWL